MIICGNFLNAQNPAFGGRPGTSGQQMNGRFYGKIIDSTYEKPIDAASVQLIQNKFDSATKKRKDFVIGGMLTKSNGEFSLENVSLFGQYKLVISAIGFRPFEKMISFDLKMPAAGQGTPDMSALLSITDKDLGNLKLVVDAQVLANVTVSAERPMLQLGIDRKIFNVDKNIVSAGGTAVDIMRNVPSLSVDLDGNVALRNNSPQIFVDGRPTTMQLDQIPADAIESVEIITNPSAKYDASGGMAGILNIVLKKNKKIGYNGSVRANIDSRARVGGGGDINIRQGKINFFSNFNVNQRKSISTGTTERLNLVDAPNTLLQQTDKGIMNGNFAFGRAGFDFLANNRNTFSASLNFGKGNFRPNNFSDLLVDTLHPVITSSFNRRNAYTSGEFRNLGATFSFKHNFPKAGREITADATINRRSNDNNNLLVTDFFSMPQKDLLHTFSQRQIGNGTSRNLVIQTDYVNPINDKTKMEMGLRAAFSSGSSSNAFYAVDPNTGNLTLQPASLIDYESSDYVLAAYTTFSQRIKDFGYNIGLRLESFEYEGALLKTNETFKNSFPVNLFPSIFLSQKLKKDQEIQLNYSRRISRPNFWQLSPFTDSSDQLNPSRGNPGLRPEFTNSFEFSYQKIFKNKDNFLASVYFKHTTDMISRFQDLQVDPVSFKEVILNTYINANSSYVTGLEMTMKNKLAKWWELTSNLNLFTSKIKLDDPAIPEQDQFISWFGKLNNNFKLPKNFSIQLSGEYQSKSILPPGGSGSGGFGRGWMGGAMITSQGYVKPNYYVDMGVRFEFMKNRQASISANFSDIFRTRRSFIHSESQFFVQDYFRRRDPQMVRVNFSWRFGKFDASIFKRRNTRGDRESMQQNMEMSF